MRFSGPPDFRSTKHLLSSVEARTGQSGLGYNSTIGCRKFGEKTAMGAVVTEVPEVFTVWWGGTKKKTRENDLGSHFRQLKGGRLPKDEQPCQMKRTIDRRGGICWVCLSVCLLVLFVCSFLSSFTL